MTQLINTCDKWGGHLYSVSGKNRARLMQGEEVSLCPTEGRCLTRKWVIQNKGSWVISVGMWRPTGNENEYEVESVEVCADKNCRLPVDSKTKIKIDSYLGNTKMNPREHLDSLDYLLEGF